MQHSQPDSETSQSHILDELGAKRLNSENDRKQKRSKASAETNGMKRTPNGTHNLNGKLTNGSLQTGLAHASALLDGSSPHASAQSLQSLVAAQNAGSVSDQLRDYTQALQWISMQNATKNGFPQQYPSPLVQAGAVPPPNLPMPVGSVPDASFQALPLNDSKTNSISMSVNANAQINRVPMALNPTSLLQLSQYMQGGAAQLPVMIQSMDPTQLQLMQAMKPPATSSPSMSSAQTSQEQSSDSKQAASLKRSHGPSVDRYKNRWSEAEITSLRNGYARFGKGGTASLESASKESGEDSNGRSVDAQFRKGDSEQVWDRILRTYDFQPCRTPRDLKDKWRQLKKKEQDDKLGVREEARRLRLLSTGPGSSLSGSTSNGNSNSGDNGSSTSSSHSHHGANNDPAADPLDSPGPSSSSPPGGSSSGSTSSPAPLGTSSAAAAAASGHNRSSGSPPPSPSPSGSQRARGDERERGGGSESGRSNEEGGSDGSGPDRDSGGADGGSEGSEGGDSVEGVASSGAEQGDGGSEEKLEARSKRRGAVEASAWEGSGKRKREQLEKSAGGCVGLALDLGSSSVTASLIRPDGSPVAGGTGQRSVHLHPTTLTLSADEYLEALCGCIDDAVSFLRAGQRASKRGSARASDTTNGDSEHPPPLPVKVVGISCFAMSLVGVSECGQAVTPAYTYADTRNAAFASELRRKLAAEGSLDFVERRTAPVQSCYAPALLLRLQQSNAEQCSKVHSWQTLSCFLLTKLTGRQQPVTLSEASWTGLMDRVELEWHHGLLSVLGVSPRSLPPLCDADELHEQGLSEEMQERWPELAHTLWSRGISDGAASNVGCRCETSRRVCVTMGPSAAMRMCTANRQARKKKGQVNGHRKEATGNGLGSPQTDAERNGGEEVPRGLWCYTLNQETMLVGGSLTDGASVYAWASRELAGSAEEMEALVAEASKMEPDGHGLTILPLFSGDSSSGYQGDAKATITGMTLRTTRAELLRGMLESVALRLKGIFNLLCQMMDDSEDIEVYASGEALFKSPLWQQILADALEVPIRLDIGAGQASSVGAAVMALRAAGQKAQVAPVKEKQVYPRREGVAAMQMAFERQEALYNRLYRPAT